MSKRKANKLFKVYMPSDRQIFVIARHAKGALTIARTEWHFGKTARAEEIDHHYHMHAVNYTAAG